MTPYKKKWIGHFTWITAVVHVVWQWLFFSGQSWAIGVPSAAAFGLVVLTGAIWFVALITALVSLKRRGLWLLLTVIVVVTPPALTHYLMWICFTHGACQSG